MNMDVKKLKINELKEEIQRCGLDSAEKNLGEQVIKVKVKQEDVFTPVENCHGDTKPPELEAPSQIKVKTESDRSGQHSRKRPHEESRYGYFEHREEKRSRTPQPPAEDEEEIIDGTLFTIDPFYSAQQPLGMILDRVNPCDSDGEEISVHPSSNSETSSDEETCRDRLDTQEWLTETAKDGTVWQEEQVGKPLHHIPIECHATDGEPSALARSKVWSRLESFLCFISLEMLQTIQECTVHHAHQTQHEDWFMSIHELMGFIAVLLLRGIIHLPSLHDAWSAKLGLPLIKRIMPRNRFQDIMQHLRFDDKDTRSERVVNDPFAAVSNVWGSFVANCIASYNPGRLITIDEQLYPTKTRCCFLQYIATKPDKFGIKFWVACDLKSKYVCNIIPYLGKDPSCPTRDTLSEKVLMNLMEPFMDKGRTVATDNFFTSLSLAQQLLSRKTTLLGSVNKIRQELPDTARNTLDRERLSTKVFSTSGATLTVYAPKRRKTVCILSSMHSIVKTGGTRKKKPNTVSDYNSMKCGVDAMDQMVRKYSVRSGTKRWPVAVFYHMIDIAALNAHVLYQACTGVKERRVDFLAELASELAQAHMAAKEVNKEQPPTLDKGKRALCQVKCCCNKNHATMRCAYCNRFTCGKCRQPMLWQCQICSDNF